MRKLYTDVTLETPFMVSYNDGQIQACANDEDTITIGAEEFIRVTDTDGHNVSDREGNQLLLNDGIIYKLIGGVPESTTITVTDVTPEPPTQNYTLTIVCNNQELTNVNIMAYDGSWEHSVTSSEGLTAEVTNIPAGTYMFYNIDCSGYNSYSGQIEMTQNETITVTLIKKPAITLESGLKLVDETGTFYLKDSNDSYVLTDASTKVIYNTSSCQLVEENTYYNVVDSDNFNEISINPFTHEILISSIGQSGYSLASCPTGNLTITLANQGTTTIDTIALTETVNLRFTCGSYSVLSNPSLTSDSNTPTITNVIAGSSLIVDFDRARLYDFSGNTFANIISNQTESATLQFTATEASTGTASITFTNTGNINATNGGLTLRIWSSENLTPNINISSADIDIGTYTIQLRNSDWDSYNISVDQVGTGYSCDASNVSFKITENETTNVTFGFEITQNE